MTLTVYIKLLSAIVFSILLTLAFPAISHAVPAAPVVHDLKQPDGSTFKARQWGDERSHGWETIDGYSVKRDAISKKWFYALINSNGELTASTLAVDKNKGKRNLKKHLRPKKYSRAQAAGITDTSSASPIVMTLPLTSNANIPVILINFNNTSTSFTDSDFEILLFGTGNNSMKDYYEEISYEAFTVSSGPGGIAGWYTASNSHDYYGQNNIYGYDKWPGTLVTEAVTAADVSFDFAPYDQDGDCYVDVVDIIHQGSGEEAGGPSTDIWSHRWNLYSAQFGYGGSGIYITNDLCPGGGYIRINDYVIQPEILWGAIQTVGVFAHEYGHALGLPDLYDTDNSSEGIGKWGLMASGSWNGVTRSGDRPAHMSAWSKLQLGWITPNIVSGMMINEPISEASGTPDVYQLLSGNQYFLVENRNRTGFDLGLPRSGLLIWHIDDSKSNNNAECYPPSNCAVNHYKVSLEQADGLWELEKNYDRGDSGDPFPGVAGNTLFSDSTTPDSNFYNGTSSNVYIADISASGSVMTATLSVSGDCSDADIDGYGDPGYSQCPNGSDTDCDDSDNEEYPGQIWYEDSDSDSFGNLSSSNSCERTVVTDVLDNTDCDDNDANNYPSNIEVCDGQDNDCNGLDDVLGFPGSETDNDGDGLSECQSDCDDADILEYPGQIWYGDADGDTYGNPLLSNECERALATDVMDNSDCNDSDLNINPLTYWYPDSDGDGFGNLTISIQQCEQLPDYVLDNSDCDDSDSNIYPGGPPLRISGTTNYYSTRQAAYDAAINGDIIQCQAVEFTDNLNANQNKSVTFDGGYDCGFIPTSNKSTISANTTISDGVLTLGNIIHN